jgi:hypothetical protein
VIFPDELAAFGKNYGETAPHATRLFEQGLYGRCQIQSYIMLAAFDWPISASRLS